MNKVLKLFLCISIALVGFQPTIMSAGSYRDKSIALEQSATETFFSDLTKLAFAAGVGIISGKALAGVWKLAAKYGKNADVVIVALTGLLLTGAAANLVDKITEDKDGVYKSSAVIAAVASMA